MNKLARSISFSTGIFTLSYTAVLMYNGEHGAAIFFLVAGMLSIYQSDLFNNNKEG